MTDPEKNVSLLEVPPHRILPLRHSVLRAGRPLEEALFDGDDAPGTLHFGAFITDECTSCLSLIKSNFEGKPAYQLRGMATLPEYAKKGIGRSLLDFAISTAEHLPVWCNARTESAGFYTKAGWAESVTPFNIEGIGPHVTMLYLPVKQS